VIYAIKPDVGYLSYCMICEVKYSMWSVVWDMGCYMVCGCGML